MSDANTKCALAATDPTTPSLRGGDMTNQPATDPETRIEELRKQIAQIEASKRADRGRPVVVCTDKRGVFFGYATDTGGDPISLTECRMCVYWSKDVRGVMGLASSGPSASCKVTKPVTEVELRGVTCVMECSDAAAEAWERDVWAS